MDLFDIVISGKIRKEGGGDVSVDALSVAENGVYTASSGHAYSPVTVSVPQGVFPSGTLSITSNGVYNVGSFASADVNVPQPSGTSAITSNGIFDIASFASVDVNVSGGGGGISIDDIAMGTIGGVVSGSATGIRAGAFALCPSVTEANFPNAVNIGSSAFSGCTSLSLANFPNATLIYMCAFSACTKLTSLFLPKVSSIGTSAFRGCSTLTSLYLLSSSVVSLGNTNAFTSTPMSTSAYTGSFGSIYVPASLVDSYKSKTGWSAFADRITSYVEE